MIFLNTKTPFPPIERASRDGLLAVGADLSPERLLTAYRSGIFPWYEADEPILWWSPPKRMVLKPSDVKISKSMRKIIRSGTFTITFNQDFNAVINACQQVSRKGQNGTWITDEMKAAFIKLHQLGHAKSIEVYQSNTLVGGLYGIDLGHIFCGESMFSLVPNASKTAFISLAKYAQENNYDLIDCQLHNPHLESLGAREIPRAEFLKTLSS